MASLLDVVETDDARPLPSSGPAPRRVLPGDPVQRVGWTLAALTVVFLGLRLWAGSPLYAAANVTGVALTLGGLLACAGAWTLRGPWARRAQVALVALWAVGLAGFGLLYITGQPGYGTDALAFNQRAAELLLDGVNPYAVSLADSLDRFLVPEQYHTWLLDGGAVERLSYPALSFLVYVPGLLLGGGMQLAFAVNVAAWIATVALLFVLLPARLRWAALVLGTLTSFVDFALGGVTDMVFLPFLVLAVWRWDRFGDPAERSWARWAGPVALGLAMCVKQTPWFALPLLLVGVAFEAHRRDPVGWWQTPARYGATVAAVFAAVNLPFVVWAPADALGGMLTPFLEPTVPAGQGIIALALFQGLGGQLALFKLAGLAAVPLAVGAFALGYRWLKPALLPLVALVFFWSTRSFASYLIDLLPAALVAGATVRAAPASATLGRLRGVGRVAVGATALVFAAAVLLALRSPQPLQLAVVDVQTTGQQQSVRQITVEVRNVSGTVLRPTFSVLAGQYLSRAWLPDGDVAVAPGASRRITLRAPNQQAMPSLEGGWTVTAFTRGPDALSSSSNVPAVTDRLTIGPSTINRPVAVGTPFTLDVQLRDRLGAPRRQAGVPVSLGQVIYTQDGILGGETRIAGRPIGQSPVTVATDVRGVARFVIVGETADEAPTWFQAWIDPDDAPPHAYSGQLAVRFVER
jgi:hypothetical protein